MKPFLRRLLITIIVIVLSASFLTWLITKDDGVIYETNNIEDYGIITGNYNNESPKIFVGTFFPERIQPHFSEVNYHYKAIKGDTYAYEMWLEFVIEDKSHFDNYVSTITQNRTAAPFAHDGLFDEYIIAEDLDIEKSVDGENYSIEYAKLGKILVSPSEQRIIFIALGVLDGGYANTNDLNYYWSRFNIEPYASST